MIKVHLSYNFKNQISFVSTYRNKEHPVFLLVTYLFIKVTLDFLCNIYTVNYPQELAQDAVCQSHTGHMTGLWFLPSPAFKAEY